MIIKIHRGATQIGGTITEIATENTRIFIDMGEELPGNESAGDFDIDGVTRHEINCDAIFLTHYHSDHVGLHKKVHSDIPIYMGEVAKEIYLALAKRVQKDTVGRIERFNTFKARDKITIKDITVTPYCVDHSAFDAYMFVIEHNGKKILHTGDFRMHGAKGKGVLQVVEKYIRSIDALIIEGTCLTRKHEKFMTEIELSGEAKEIFSRNTQVLVLCSSTNIDRIAAFHKALPKGRYFVCDHYQKEVLDIVSKYSFAKTTFYDFSFLQTFGDNLVEKMKSKGFCMLIRNNNTFLKNIEKFPDAILIYSMWNGYLHGKHKNEKLSKITDKYPDFIQLHTSGHASTQDIMTFINAVKPKVVIPIHTEKPENMLESKYPVTILEDGQEFSV